MSENEKNLTEQEWIDVARDIIFNQSDVNKACYHYFKAQELNPDNAEAAFFVDYLGYKTLLKDGNTPAAVRAFQSMAKDAAISVMGIKEYKGIGDNAAVIAGAIAITFTPITRYVFTQLRWTAAANIEGGVLGLYALGDALEKHFGDGATITNLAVDAWKEGIALQRQFYAYKYDDVNPEDYAAKIQKVDPTYTMPNKSGCISLAK